MSEINKVNPGERLKAATVNKIIKRLDGITAPQVSTTAASQQVAPGTSDNLIRIKNNTDKQLLRMHVVSIGEITNEENSSEVSYMDGVVFVAELPDDDKPCALVVEPISPGAIGLAMIYGVYQAKVEIEDEDHQFAKVEDGETGYLVSADNGPFSILWKNTDSPAHCFVQFPASKVAESNGGQFRQHSHASNSWQDGGFSFSVFSSGSGVPALPWE